MRETERLQVLSEAVSAFAEATGDMQRLVQVIVQRTSAAFDGFCAVGLLAPDGTTLVPAAAYAKDPEALALFRRLHAGMPVKLTDPHPVAQVVRSGKPLLMPSAELERLRHTVPPDAAAMLERFPPKSTLHCPLSIQGPIIGSLTIARFGEGATPLDERDLELAQSLAHHAALAITNARSLDAARAQSLRLQALSRATQEFSAAAREPEPLLQLVVQRVGELVGEVVSIRLIDASGEQLGTRAVVYHPDPALMPRVAELLATPQRVGEGLSGGVARSGQPLRVERLDPATVPPEFRPLFDLLRVSSLLVVPLQARGKMFGVVTLSRPPELPPYSEDDARVVHELAAHAALAIENGQLFEQLQQELAERKRGEVTAAELRRQRDSEARFRGLLESAPDAIVIMRSTGEVTFMNRQAEALFGRARHATLGRDISIVIPTGLEAQLARPTAGSRLLELEARRSDGVRFPIELSLSPLVTDEGLLLSAVIRDMSERKRAEAALVSASRMKSEFLANMSHELRTPLNAIIGFAELMHRGRVGPVSPEHHEYLGDILTSSRHLLQLINDILDLAKVESGKMDFYPEPVDVAALAAEVADVLRGLATMKSVRLTLDVAPDLGVEIDPARFKQVMFNFVSNAIKFTPEGGEVKVRLAGEDERRFRLDVTDTGVGISDEDLPRLFVQFQQLDAGPAKRFQGTGLGLALTRRLVEQQGGTVSVVSKVGVGSTFSAVLPTRRVG